MSIAGKRSRRRPAPRVALTVVVGLVLASLAVPASAVAAADARAREYAHKIINTWDRSPTALEKDTGGDGVVQRSEMRIMECANGQGVSRDARAFFDHIDGRGGPRDRKGQFREAFRFMKSFDRNHNGLSNGELGKAGLRYAARVEIVRC